MSKLNITQVCNGDERGAYNWRRFLNHGYRYDQNKVITMAYEQSDWEQSINRHSYISFTSDAVIDREKLMNYIKDHFGNWVLGQFIRHSVLLNSKIQFGKNSLTIGLCGISLESLFETTENLFQKFGVTYALVKDCSSQRVFFATNENNDSKGGKICSAILQF